MRTTIEFLDAVRARHHLTSDYQLAHFLQITRMSVSEYRNSLKLPSERVALRIADALDLPHAHVLATVAAERSKDMPARRAWRAAAAAVLLVLFAVALPAVAPAPAPDGAAVLVQAVYWIPSESLDMGIPEWIVLFVLSLAALTYTRATLRPLDDAPHAPPKRRRRKAAKGRAQVRR